MKTCVIFVAITTLACLPVPRFRQTSARSAGPSSAHRARSSYIAYLSHGQIWLADPSGKPLRSIASPGLLASDPDWSRIGKLAFLATGPNQVIKVCTENADGSGLRTIFTSIPESSMSGPVWSPDSKQLAFGYNGAIYTIRADGKNLRKLVDAIDLPDVSAWSADGRTILFDTLSLNARLGGSEIFELPIQRGKPRNITPAMFRKKGASALFARWMPDHKRIAFIGHDQAKGPRYHIYTFDANKPAQQPKQLIADSSESYDDSDFSFSPDGKKIVFGRSPSELGVPQIWIADINGSSAKVFITEPDPEPRSGVDSPAWSPSS